VLGSLQDHLGIGTHDLDHPPSADAESTDSWHARKGDLFPLDISVLGSLQDHPETLAITVDGECLSCDASSLGKTIHFRTLEFIVVMVCDNDLE
jgi:hypothetical protein